MSKYKVGEKFVVEIDGIDEVEGEIIYFVKGKVDAFDEDDLSRLEFLTDYTDPLKSKIRRQAAEITQLLKENKDLWEWIRKDIDHLCGLCAHQPALDKARAEGQKEAWELMRKIASKISVSELRETFNDASIALIIKNNTYAEAAEKVAAWKDEKNEIHVGDVAITQSGETVVVVHRFDQTVRIMDKSGYSHAYLCGKLKKTGRTLPVQDWLAQIGGYQNE